MIKKQLLRAKYSFATVPLLLFFLILFVAYWLTLNWMTKNEKMIHHMWFIIQHHIIVFYLSIDTIKN